jgi:hypothetical protein
MIHCINNHLQASSFPMNRFRPASWKSSWIVDADKCGRIHDHVSDCVCVSINYACWSVVVIYMQWSGYTVMNPSQYHLQGYYHKIVFDVICISGGHAVWRLTSSSMCARSRNKKPSFFEQNCYREKYAVLGVANGGLVFESRDSLMNSGLCLFLKVVVELKVQCCWVNSRWVSIVGRVL